MRPTLPADPPSSAQARRSRRARPVPALPPAAGAALSAVAVTVLIVLLTRTLFADGQRLIADFSIDSLYIKQQAHWLSDQHAPSLFVSTNTAAFYPLFTFYGGTMFVGASLLALLTGSAAVAQSIVYALALLAAYGGWLWLARQAGLRSWSAHAPAVLYVTAPYVLTNVYARQDLAESVGTAAMPLLVASAVSILRADRLRAGPAAALAASTIAFGGAHNLTLLWGTSVLAVGAAVIAVAVPASRTLVTRRGVLRVLAVAVPAMAVNGWYLVPDLVYHSHTVIAARAEEWKALFRAPNTALELKHLLAPTPWSAGAGAGYSLPALAVLWVALAGLTARSRWRSLWGRVLLALALVTVALVFAMTHARVLTILPEPWLMLQGSSRLDTYVLFGICGSVIAALALTRQRPRWLTALLVPILLLSVTGALAQIRDAPLAPSDFRADIDHAITFSIGDFADTRLPVVPEGAGATRIELHRSDVRDGRADVATDAAPGELVRTNLMTLPELLRVQGARVVGRQTAPPLYEGWQQPWYLVLRIDDDAVPGRVRIVLSEARSLPIVAGKVISVLGLAGLLAVAIAISRPALLRARARPRRPRS